MCFHSFSFFADSHPFDSLSLSFSQSDTHGSGDTYAIHLSLNDCFFSPITGAHKAASGIDTFSLSEHMGKHRKNKKRQFVYGYLCHQERHFLNWMSGMPPIFLTWTGIKNSVMILITRKFR